MMAVDLRAEQSTIETTGNSLTSTSAGYSGALSISLPLAILDVVQLQSVMYGNLNYEYFLNKRSSIVFDAGLGALHEPSVAYLVSSAYYYVYDGGAFYNWYPFNKAPSGIYLGVGGEVATFDQTYDLLWGPAVDAGYQWLFFGAWTIKLGMSYTYNIASQEERIQADEVGGKSRANFVTGFAWH
jgi:hypothetical protein